ncbi:MAG: hypothetical protein KDA61_21640, partial [Planctomycetales bacterium]|nr:hypothetical protein [Planctomycetales bacterium]
MAFDPGFHARLHELLCRLRDGEPSQEMVDEVEGIVLGDPVAMRQYLEFMRLDAAAEALWGASPDLPLGLEIGPDWAEPTAPNWGFDGAGPESPSAEALCSRPNGARAMAGHASNERS